MRFLGGSFVLIVAIAGCTADESNISPASDLATVEIIRDVVYGHKFGMALTFDVYRPALANGAAVVIMNSGGYQSPIVQYLADDDETPRLRTHDEHEGLSHQFSPWPLLENGFTLFNVRHGSSPKFLVPEIVDDVRRAIRTIRRVAPEYGVNPERLGLWGGSAGGHLSLMLGAASELGPDGVNSAAAPVAAVVAYFPPSDFVSERSAAATWTRETLGQDLLAVFPAAGYPVERDPEFSPINYVTADDPPTLIIHGDQDTLVPLAQGQLMHDALRGVGVESELVVIEGAAHGFEADDAELALARTVAWFQAYLQ